MYRARSSATSRFASALKTAQYVVPVTADFEFLNEAKRRFHGDRFEHLYKSWDSGALSEQELRREFCQNEPDRTVFFETLSGRPTSRHISPKTNARTGERGMKDTDHSPVHRSVHLCGERNLSGAIRIALRDIRFWARAKHRTGLERPHLWRPTAAQRPRGVAPAQCLEKVR